MPATLAPAHPDVRTFETTVDSVDGREVTLSKTYFYAESGGQPADRGALDGVRVADVQSRDGDIVHVLDEPPAFEAGDTISARIDDEFRTYCMRAHTASHVLYGAGRGLLADLGYGGFDISPEKVRVDFTTTTDIDDETLVELERRVNRVVWESRPVTWEQRSLENALDDPNIAFNTKTEEGVMADADAIRVVTVGAPTRRGDTGDGGECGGDGPWDVAACGGTHVSNTREIGPVEVLSRSNPGEGMTRVEFAVGPNAVERRAAVKRAALDAAREVGTSVTELPAFVAKLRSDKEELAAELREAKTAMLAADLDSLPAVERDGSTWRVGVVSGVGPNDVGDELQSRVGDGTDAVAVAGEQGSTFVVVATDGEVNAGGVVDEITDEFGGGGGGSPTFAQGGGLSASPEDVAESLREP
ncbi:alanine--tRNA ligase-related protein [Haloprofundus salilacus]|uniref:alanine--tRNA ligase-related protein n=1 Tax=Haloprofundus salilacus TaxID=2876190 RepID=UPI001CCBC833|nr:alanine--tRNA ligase-related protein [Haloprofundus salilacus]